MARQEETLRWQFLLDEDRWESQSGTAELLAGESALTGGSNPIYWLSRVWALTFSGILLAGAASLFWLWQEAQAGLDAVRDELTAAIEREVWAEEREDRMMAVDLLDDLANPTWRNQIMARFYPPADERARRISVTISDFDLKESRALVQVLVTDSRLAVPYQETRVYRETNTGWIRTAPDAAFWGTWESQESEYFAFRYRALDRAPVIVAAPLLDQLYEKTYRSIGLPVEPEGEKIQVEVRIDGTISRGSTRNPNGRILAVASPHLLPRPLGLSVETALVESVILQVINLVIWERMDRIPGDWQAIRSGLRLWLIWQVDGILAQTRPEIVRWLYNESIPGDKDGESRRPQNYAQLCQSFWLWQLRPYEIGIPLTCDQTEGQVFIPVRMPVELRQLPMPEMDPEFRGSWTRLNTGRAVAVATLFEFIENRYGPASIPAVLKQTGSHLRWQKLIPAALGVPANEFEEGWQAYMRQVAASR